MVLHESGEDYLEAILVLRQQKGNVRSIDVAQHLGFSKPSVSRAVSILKSNGYLNMEKDGRLELTPQGESEAQRVYERHRFLSEWLVMLGVSPEVAAADACRIERRTPPGGARPPTPAASSTTSAPRPLNASSATSASTPRTTPLDPFRRARDWSAPARRFVCF